MEKPPGDPDEVERDTSMSLDEASRSVEAFFGPLGDLYKQSGIETQAELAERAEISPAAVSTCLSWKTTGHESTLIALLKVLYTATGRTWNEQEEADWLARRKAARRGNHLLNQHGRGPETREALRTMYRVRIEDDEADLWVPEWWLKEHGPRRRPLGRRVRRFVWVLAGVGLTGIALVVVLSRSDVADALNLRAAVIGLVVAALVAASLVIRRRRRHGSMRAKPERYRAEMLRRVQRIWVDDYLSTFADLPASSRGFFCEPRLSTDSAHVVKLGCRPVNRWLLEQLYPDIRRSDWQLTGNF